MKHFRRLFPLAIAVAALVTVGCTDQAESPLAPSDTAEEFRGWGSQGNVFQALNRRGFTFPGVAVALVTPESGATLNAGSASLYIPPGAVDSPTRVRMIVPGGPFSIALFSPHGLEFNTPATLSFEVDDPQGGVVGVYIDQNRGLWNAGRFEALEVIPATYENGTLSYPIEHFSGYIGASDFH